MGKWYPKIFGGIKTKQQTGNSLKRPWNLEQLFIMTQKILTFLLTESIICMKSFVGNTENLVYLLEFVKVFCLSVTLLEYQVFLSLIFF